MIIPSRSRTLRSLLTVPENVAARTAGRDRFTR